jgi:hypothetical protein
MENMGGELLYFDAIKESRDSYFVEYKPPANNNTFAILNVVFPGVYDLTEVKDVLLVEMKLWLVRYPVPVMISAWNVAENIIRPNGYSDDACLIGWYAPGTSDVAWSWKISEIPAFLNEAKNLPDWRTIYKGVPYKTDTEVKADAQKQFKKTRKQNITLVIIALLWVALIPAVWETIKYFGPHWLEFSVYIYALWQAFRAARKLLWRNKPTQLDDAQAEKERKMAHYFYHCERNPAGFAKVLIENVEKDSSERIRKEAEELAKKQRLNT